VRDRDTPTDLAALQLRPDPVASGDTRIEPR
jgi:hypothetical protein